MDRIRVQFTLFSAFYSPLIATMSAGFLKAEGLDSEWSVSPPGVSALDALKDRSAHVVQSALSQGLTSLDQGEAPAAVRVEFRRAATIRLESGLRRPRPRRERSVAGRRGAGCSAALRIRPPGDVHYASCC